MPKIVSERYKEFVTSGTINLFSIEELDKLDVTFKEGELSKREKKFKKLKPKIEKEFKIYKDVFLLVELDNWMLKGYHNILCYNAFQISYHHNGWCSGIQIELIDVFANKLIDVTKNCYVSMEYNKDVLLKTILEDRFIEVKKIKK